MMKGVLALLVIASVSFSCARRRATGFRLERDVSYLGSAREEKLDLYFPSVLQKDSEAPAFICIHGNSHDKGDQMERQFCEMLAGAGYVCAAINYGPWTPALLGDAKSDRSNLEDAKNAVRFLRAHAIEYHIDPSRIAVGGGSAGGYLALMVGFTSGDASSEPRQLYPGVSSRVSAVVDFYGLFDWLADPKIKERILALPASVFAEMRTVEPVTYVSSQSPPVFIAHGRDDPLMSFEHSVALDRALTEKSVPHELILFDGIGHSFDLTTWKKKPLPRDLRPLVLAFLNKHLGPQSTIARVVH